MKTHKSPVSFFYQHAGHSYDPKTETKAQGRWRCARALANAERWASESGVSFAWQVDPDCDSSEFCDEKPAWPLWCCIARDADGKVIGSLGAVDFGDGEPWGDNYRRVVGAEIALEAMTQP